MPAKEWHVQPLLDKPLRGLQIAHIIGASPDDMIALAIWADAVHRDGGMPVAIIPYLPGARQDRRLPGEALSCKVYADLINSCNLDQVVCVDPHSDVMPALINRCSIISVSDIFKRFMSGVGVHHYQGFIAPDVGAAKRVFNLARAFKKPVFQAFKHRDMETGKLSGFSCEDLPSDGRFLIVDDICDGGGTFMGLANAIGIDPERLDLWVTHGVFSGDNAANLRHHFGRILTTDSYPGRTNAMYVPEFEQKVKIVEIFEWLDTKVRDSYREPRSGGPSPYDTSYTRLKRR